MNTLKRISFPLLITMIVVLPFWISLGRAITFNIGGYYLLLYFIYSAVIFGWLIYIYKSLKRRDDVNMTGSLKTSDAVLLVATYIAIFIHGFFWLDQADSLDQVSGATVWLHMSSGISWVFSILTFIISIFLLCLCSVLATPRPKKH